MSYQWDVSERRMAVQLVADNYELRVGQRDVNALNKEVKSLEYKLKETETELNTLRKQCEERKDEHRVIVEKLQQELTNLNKMKEEYILNLNKRQDTGKLDSNIERKELEIENLNSDIAKTKEDTSQLNRSLNEMNKDINKLKQEKEELLTVKKELLNNQTELEVEQRKLEQSLINLKLKHEELTTELSETKIQLRGMNLEVTYE